MVTNERTLQRKKGDLFKSILVFSKDFSLSLRETHFPFFLVVDTKDMPSVQLYHLGSFERKEKDTSSCQRTVTAQVETFFQLLHNTGLNN